MIKVATRVGFIFFIALEPSKLAPIHINAIGVAVAAIDSTVLFRIVGNLMLSREATKPITIPIIIGFLRMLMAAFLMLSFLEVVEQISLPWSSGWALKVRIVTAKILNNGTAATIIRGAIPASL